MSFTSEFFLIGLFPVFAFLYILIGCKLNAIRIFLLLAANSLFLIWGGAGSFLFLCAFSILVFLLSIFVYKVRKRWTLAISLLLAAAPLIVIKYTMFIIQQINSILRSSIKAPSLLVPVGISFVTFEAVSLLVDIYREKVKSLPGLLNTYLYLTFFPTVTSGPILRYDSFQKGLHSRNNTCDYSASIERIVIGLCKKVLIADKLSILADFYFNGVAKEVPYSCIGLWIGSIAYTLQLYYDFSGYSDMAIGIGKLLGFNIIENFNRPYRAISISDFWKRWHISLTQWFRDYIYIPLGGNRCSKARWILNMFVVWLLTGIWHGADWTFIIWGLAYFVLLTAEKNVPWEGMQMPRVIGHLYTLFFVNLLWVPFRASNLAAASAYIRGMFGGGSGLLEEKAVRFLPFLTFSILLCLPWEKAMSGFRNKTWYSFLRGSVIILLTVLAVCGVANSSYAPYIYGTF